MQEIEKVVRDRAAKLTAGDVTGLLALYAPRITEFTLAPPLAQPGDARDEQPLRQWMSKFEAPPRREVTELEVTAGADVAFATCLESMTATVRGMEEFTMWYRTTLGLRRLDGNWVITHEHTSVPFYMDGSLRAATDLKP